MPPLPASLRLGPVSLTVADLDRSVTFYERVIGLRLLERDGGRAVLGRGEPLLELVEEPGARPANAYSGLYHFALLVPERADLARWLVHAAREGVPFEGFSDHRVSEAVYLRDPDRHGIEVYRDRDRSLWEGKVAQDMTTLPLDVDDLVGSVAEPLDEPWPGMPDGTTMGHVHLQVGDVGDTVAFYRDRVGFELMAEFRRQAAFLAAGGYHHHLGANVWHSRGAGPAPTGYATLRHFTVVLPDAATRDAVAAAAGEAEERTDGLLVRDPSGNGMLLAV